MKKLYFSALGALMGLAFISCSKSMDFEGAIENNIKQKYEVTFVNKYGQPAANQQWGFDVYGVDQSQASASRRAADKKGKPEKWNFSCRIIGEDLTVSENSDFDFNDIVFDVVVEGKKNTQLILQAAGGVYPIYIKHGKDSYEIHKQFGVDTNQMVNTGKGSIEKDPVTIQTDWNIPNESSVHEIQIYVEKNGVKTELQAQQGEPAAKICVPITFEWCDERQSIEKVYKGFSEWVKDKDYIWF